MVAPSANYYTSPSCCGGRGENPADQFRHDAARDPAMAASESETQSAW